MSVVWGASGGLLWLYRRVLNVVFGHHGADFALQLLAGAWLADLVFQLGVVWSGAPGFQVYDVPLGLYRVAVAYPHLRAAAMGIFGIAAGYALLRIGDDADPLNKPYAYSHVALGASSASLAGGLIGFVPAALGHLILARMFWNAAALQPEARAGLVRLGAAARPLADARPAEVKSAPRRGWQPWMALPVGAGALALFAWSFVFGADSLDESAKRVLQTVAIAEEAAYTVDETYVSCTNRECELRLAALKTTVPEVQVSMTGHDTWFSGTARHPRGRVTWVFDSRFGGIQPVCDEDDPLDAQAQTDIERLAMAEEAHSERTGSYVGCRDAECGTELPGFTRSSTEVRLRVVAEDGEFFAEARHARGCATAYWNTAEGGPVGVRPSTRRSRWNWKW